MVDTLNKRSRLAFGLTITPTQIKQLRLDLGRARRSFAHILKTTETTIYRWETGKSAPNKTALEKLNKLQTWIDNNNKTR